MGTIRSAATILRKSAGAAALLLFLSPQAADAAGFVKTIALRTRTSTTNSSITASIPSSGVAAGNSLILTLQAGDLAGAVSCSDPVNGVYDSDIVSTAGTTRIAIVSKHNVAAMGFGTVITCTYPLFNGPSSLGVYEFTGLEPAGTLDRTSEGGGSGAGAATSGLTAATSQASELVFGFVWVTAGQTFTAATSGGNPLEDPYAPPYTPLAVAGTQRPMYRLVSSIRQYEANGTVAGAGTWKALLATYRLAPDLCTGVDCSDGNDCTADSCDPATGACGHTALPMGVQCGDRSSEACDFADSCDGAGACQPNHVEDGAVCAETAGDCQVADTCQQGTCQDNGLEPAGTACGNAAAGACDAADSCDSFGLCLANLAPDGTSCGDAGDECVRADSCQAGACQDNGFVAAGSPCGDTSSGACDAADQCDGLGGCFENHVASGTSCDDSQACTTEDACDGSGECGGERDELCFACIDNVAPVVAAAVLAVPSDPIALAAGGVTLTASFTDSIEQTRSCIVDWDDESLSDHFAAIEPAGADPGRCVGSHVYTAPGVYEVAVTVADMCGDAGAASYRYAVVYDSSGGFVTGGGWIPSPEGAYRDDPGAVEMATFGLSAKYEKGSQASDQIQVRFQAGAFRFIGASYDWLVLSGARARLRGAGAANGVAGHGFELTASDGQAPGGGGIDRFRIKVWESSSGDVVYDNLLGASDSSDPAPLGGGSIVISKK